MELIIAGQTIPFRRDTLEIKDYVDERSTLRVIVDDLSAAHHFIKGQPVEFYDGSDIIFGGVIERTEERKIGIDNALAHEILAIDWHYLTDKRVIAKLYQNITPGDVVADLVDTILHEEGITIDESVDQGHELKEVVFNYVPISEALDALKESANFWWRVDANKVLHFVDRAHYTFYETLDADDMLYDSVRVVHTAPKYRNRQWVRGIQDDTDPVTETKHGDGDSRDFALGYRLSRVPTIEVSYDSAPYVEQDVGIKGLDSRAEGIVDVSGTSVTRVSGSRFMPRLEGRHITINGSRYVVDTVHGHDSLDLTASAGNLSDVEFYVNRWYWERFAETIAQDREDPALVSVDRLRVTYRGVIDIIIRTQDSSAIIELQTIEGVGTGMVEVVDDKPELENREAGFQYGASKLAKYAKMGRTLTFTTRRNDIKPGHLATVDLPEHGLNNTEMLVENIEMRDYMGTEMRYYIKAVEGPTGGSWTKFFHDIAVQGKTFVVRENIGENETLALLYQFFKDWTEEERPNIMLEVYPSESVYPDGSFYPMIKYDDRVKYVEWKVDGSIQGRKQLTVKQGLDTDDVYTMVHITPHEGIGFVEEIHWYGGTEATAAKGTGIKVAEETINESKTELESWQIDRNDRQGWS